MRVSTFSSNHQADHLIKIINRNFVNCFRRQVGFAVADAAELNNLLLINIYIYIYIYATVAMIRLSFVFALQSHRININDFFYCFIFFVRLSTL